MKRFWLGLICIVSSQFLPSFASAVDKSGQYPIIKLLPNRLRVMPPVFRVPDGGLSDFSWQQLTPYVEKHGAPLNWAQIMTTPEPVVYVGEEHYSDFMRQEFAVHLADMKAAGITDLGMEMLDDDQQPLLDAYAKDDSYRQQIVNVMEKNQWSKPYNVESYVQVLDAAKKAGLRMVALNMVYDGYQVEDNVAYDCRKKAKTANPCDDIQSVCVNFDCWMASNISARLQKDPPGSRFVVLIGAAHVEESMQPQELHDARGLDSKSYAFVWRNSTYPQEQSLNTSMVAAGLGQQRTFLPVPKDTVNIDGYLYLPP